MARPPARPKSPRGRDAPPRARPASFTLIGKHGKTKKPSRDFMAALNSALPDTAGQGPYWRAEILAARAAYPELPTACPPKACQCKGDRGRLYPAYYLTTVYPRAGKPWRICRDCVEALRAPKEHAADKADAREFRERRYITEDGAVWQQAGPTIPEEPPEPEPETPPSPLGAVLEQMATRGQGLTETELPTADARVLARQLAAYRAGDSTAFPAQ